MKIVFIPEAIAYFNELSTILFEKDYFGFLDAAEKYVDDLVDDIKSHLPHKTKRPAPPYFDKYGKKMYYSVFRKSKATQWYVFFNVYESGGERIFLVRYISNNHVMAQLL